MKRFDCNSVLELLSEYLDADDRDELCQQIKEHLARCQDCRVYVDSVKKTIVLYQDHTGQATELPVRATAKLAAAMKDAYKRQV